MNIVTLINKLEKQKQNIEAALSVLRAETETPVTAKKVTESLRNGSWFTKKVANLKHKGFRYKGKHWTQKPENRAKLMKMVKANGSKRRKKS